MRRFVYILIFFFVLSLDLGAQGWDWTYTEHKDNQETGLFIDVDSEQNFYVLSSYSNGYFGSGGGYVFHQVKKFSSSKQLLWSKEIKARFVNVRSFFISNDSIYIYGSYEGGDPSLIPGKSGSSHGAFLMVLDKNGNFAKGNYIHNGVDSSIGSWEGGQLSKYSDGFYFISNLNSIFLWGEDTIVKTGGANAVIIKFDKHFNVRWKKVIPYEATHAAHHIRLFSDRLLISGGLSGSMTVDGTTVSSSSENYLMSLDTSGQLKWLRTYGGPANMYLALETDHIGSSYVHARAYNSASFGMTNLNGSGSFYYLAKYDIGGNLAWAKKTDAWYADIIFLNHVLLCPVIDSVNGVRYIQTLDLDGNIINTLEEKNVHANAILPYTSNSILITGDFRPGSSLGPLGPSSPGCFPCNNMDMYVAERSSSDLAIGVNSVEDESDFRIYPNPASEILFISTKLKNYELKLFNSIGEQVSSNSTYEGTSAIDIGEQSSGLYILELRCEDHCYRRKIIVK